MFKIILTRINVRDILVTTKGSVSMKEMLTNKSVIAFILVLLSITIYGCKEPNNTVNLESNEETIIFNA